MGLSGQRSACDFGLLWVVLTVLGQLGCVTGAVEGSFLLPGFCRYRRYDQ